MRPARQRAFTLLEVMIAVMIFFMCMFTILSLVSSSLSHVRAFQQQTLSPGTVASQLYVSLTHTNSATEGTWSGELGDMYPDYKYEAELSQTSSNGLCQLDIALAKAGEPQGTMSILIFIPTLRQGVSGGGIQR